LSFIKIFLKRVTSSTSFLSGSTQGQVSYAASGNQRQTRRRLCPFALGPSLAAPRRHAPRLESLERAIAGRAPSGILGLDDALKLFDDLFPDARLSSVSAFN
jgi:hypothetical protein